MGKDTHTRRKKNVKSRECKDCLPESRRQMLKATHGHFGKSGHRAETQAVFQWEIKMCL